MCLQKRRMKDRAGRCPKASPAPRCLHCKRVSQNQRRHVLKGKSKMNPPNTTDVHDGAVQSRHQWPQVYLEGLSDPISFLITTAFYRFLTGITGIRPR